MMDVSKLLARASSDSSGSNGSGSVQTVVTALVYNGIIFLVFIGLFLILRPRNPRVYEKRVSSSTVAPNEKPRPLNKGWVAWLTDLVTRKDAEVLRDTGLDGYFFLRFLRFLFYICAFGICFLMPILLPVNATNGKNLTGLDLLAFGNVTNKNRYYAHVFCSWVFFGVVLFFIYRELLFYTAARQAVLTSDSYKYRLSSRSVLINSIPSEQLDEAYIRSTFQGVKHVFIGHDSKKLTKEVKNRDKLASKLEAAENKIIRTGVKNRLKAEKKGEATKDDILSYIKKFPTHRLKFLIGEKVETIDYAKKEIPKLNEKIAKMQQDYHSNKKLSAAIVVFETQLQAEVAAQMLSFHRPLEFAPRTVGVRPDEVIWENLSVTWWQRLVKSFAAGAFCTALIIFWAIPVAFVGFISQIDSLIRLFPWLSFLHKLPTVLYGLISSLLPTILLAVLMMLLPIIIRKMARIAGAPTQTHVEYYTQQVYFAFQVVQVFLVTTLASSILSALKEILDNPSSILSLLQAKLPAASNFYMSWMLLQALTIPSGAVLQIVALILFHALGRILDNSPRKAWSRQNIIGGTGWGTVLPVYTNMAVITFTYSIISPLILPFSAALFLFTYLAFLNNLTFVNGLTNGRGIYYARALQQLFVGLYLAELVMIAMFVFSKAWGPVVLEVIMILVTVWVQMRLSEAFNPMLFVLPRSLLDNSGSAVGYYKDNGSYVTATGSGSSAKAKGDTFATSGNTPRDHYNTGKVSPEGTAPNGAGRFNSSEIDRQSTQATVNAHHNWQSQADHPLVDQERYAGQTATPPPSGSFLERLFKPHIYFTPEVLRQTLLTDNVWHETPAPLTAEEEANAFHDPAVNSTNPVVWFPNDPYGWADEQMSDLRHAGINAYTSGAWFQVDQEKKKAELEYTNDATEIPIFEKPSSI